VATAREGLGDETDDVGLTAGQSEQARAGAADEDGRVWLLHRFRQPFETGDRVMLSLELDRSITPQSADDMQRFLHAADTRAGGIKADAGPLVFLLVPAGTESELEAAATEQIEGRGLFRQERRVAIVVGEDDAADSKRRRNGRDRGQGRHRGEWIEEVVGHHQCGVAASLSAAGLLLPVAPVSSAVGKRGEAEWSWHCPSISAVVMPA
jgi:hypothetical protein